MARRTFARRTLSFVIGTILGVAASIISQPTFRAQAETNLEVPERLKYLFDLPWCRKWSFGCVACSRSNNEIQCEMISKRADCTPPFQVYHCVDVVVPKGCVVWSDGCNTCQPSP